MTTARSTTTSAAAQASLGRKLAALAGATGAVTAGTATAGGFYEPTAGVVAAQGIPGFSFVSDTNVTLGTLRPPASNGYTYWDIDGVGGNDFRLRNNVRTEVGVPSTWVAYFGPDKATNSMIGQFGEGIKLSNLATGANVGLAGPWRNSSAFATTNGGLGVGLQNFAANTSGQFGFRFTSGGGTFYGWGSLVPDFAAAPGQGFKITEAYYHSTPGTAIDIGAVPVPEPSSMVLLAIGAAGLTAWRSRRGKAS